MEMESFSEEQKSEFFVVVKEILSLHRYRRELLASLTPAVSVWKQGGQETLIRFAGKDYTAAAPVEVPVQEMETVSASTEEQLERYFDSILQDMEDLNHRMLSMAYLVAKPDSAALSSYMADELVSSTSVLMDACKDLCEVTKDKKTVGDAICEEKINANKFIQLYHRALMEPRKHENKLVLIVTKEEEDSYEKEEERKKKRLDELNEQNRAKFRGWLEQHKETKKYDMEEKEVKGKMHELEFVEKGKGKGKGKGSMESMEFLHKGMEVDMKFFADNRDCWNTVWGCKSTRCGDFQDKTTLSPMHFTHCTPDTIRVIRQSTLQIYSIKILELKEGLKWPLKLYGVVAARDTVDRNRNIVFSRSRLKYQELNENGFLCLTGPSRAIVALDYVDFEVELNIAESEGSPGKELITLSKRYNRVTQLNTGTSLILENSLCKAELRLKQLSGAVQATILGVCVVEGKWPFDYGCEVVCYLDQDGVGNEVVLLDGSKEVHVGSNDYLHLSRNVVSVESQGILKVVIRSYNDDGKVDLSWTTVFSAQTCQTTECECSVGTTKVKVVVAWSALVTEKRDLLVDSPTVEP